jgi:twitching motility protein PilJ/methyl-accepting chemotaxis protein PixJ
MTQIPSKPTSTNGTNGLGSSSKNLQIEGLTSATNYSSAPLPLLSSQEQKAITLLKSKEIVPRAKTQGGSLPQRSARWWQAQSLRNKATALAIALGTVPVLLTGVTSYYFANQQITQQISDYKISRAVGAEDKVKRFMRERYGDIQGMSRRNFLTNPTVAKTIPLAEKEEELNQLIKDYEVYDVISVTDLQGNVILKSKSDPLPNQSDREYFQAVLKMDKPVIANAVLPAVSANPDKPAINLAAPVKDSTTGKTIAIIRARMPVDSIDEVIKNFQADGDEYYLVDTSNQKIFLGSDKKKEFKEALPIFPSLPKLQAANKPTSLVFSDQLDKSEKLFAYAKFGKLEGMPDLDWQVMIATPTSIAFASQRQLLLLTTIGTIVTTVLVSAIASLIANRATRPILNAAGAVDKIGQGELDTRLEVQGEDELSQLGANINQMAGQLEIFVEEQALAAEQARLLAKITGSRAFSTPELYALFDKTLQEVRKILKVDRVVIYNFTADGRGEITAESVAGGWSRALNNKPEELLLSEQRLEAYKEGRALSISNVLEADLPADQLRFMERLEVKANLEVPILHEGQPFGLLMAHHCSTTHEWQPSEVNFFKQLAAQLGLSIDRVILLEQTEQLADEQRQLKEGLQKRALELLMEVDPISKGDLTIRAKVTADEIGTIADSYNATVSNLRKIVLQVQAAATQVADTASSNEVSVQSLSVEALRQAEEIAAALERAQEMAQSVRLVAANAELAEAAVQQAAQTVEEGDVVMNRTVDGILAIRETVAETAKKVKHLGESSQKISTVVNLISNFAAQTNLLALNASIEAARAGEGGRGFAVVADEVRALAQQSAEATSEIEKLVAAIQGETNEVVTAMEAGTEQVVTGTKLVDETRQSLNKITAASAQISKLVESITEATVVQSKASEAVTQTMTNVAAIANKTSQEASFVSSSFEQLRKVAQTLQEDVGQFKVS